MKPKEQEKYLGFYTKDPFWSIKQPKILEIKNDAQTFSQALSEIAIQHSDQNFELVIFRDGLILLKIMRLEKLRETLDLAKSDKPETILEFNSEYLSHFNTFQFLLASGTYSLQRFNYFRNKSLSENEIFTALKKGNSFDIIGLSNTNNAQQFYLARYLSSYTSIMPVELDYRIRLRGIIEEKVFVKCIEDFGLLFKHEDSFFILSQINSSFSEFSNLNFRQSIILAWYSIEYFINKSWINYLLQKKETSKITGERRDILLGRDYTSSIMTNVLELNGNIPAEIFAKIDKIRGKRNSIVHSLDKVKKLSNSLKEKPVKKESQPIQLIDCLDAFDCLVYFCKTFYGIDIRFPVGFTYMTL